MKAFHFTLQAVQTLRHRQQQQAIESYIHALMARQQAADRLEAIRDKIRVNHQEICRILTSAVATVAPIAQATQYESVLETKQTELAVALALAERRLQNAFQAMLSARRRSSMVAKLRDKQFALHNRAQWREEQKTLDDLAARRVTHPMAWKAQEIPS